MRFIADFHIHSHYSRATTPQLTPENLDHWARIKGIQVVGTGDCVHAGWLDELEAALEPAGNGLYRLRRPRQLAAVTNSRLREAELLFLLTTEISSIYKKRGRVRKVHNICVLPDFAAARCFHERLAAIGNVHSDGRPILGLDAKHVLELLLESSADAYLIPAHIWTPWFAVLGSQSGFDSLEECFDDLTSHIFAVETGLSSDPAMNRICSRLDRVRLVSNSDAHSPEKLGREANLFDTDLSYHGILRALKDDNGGFLGTIEFFPEEGKYHYDGHRKCGVRWDPLETLHHRGRCSGCGKPVTRGVMYRVAQLADRPDPRPFYGKQRAYSITPLPELIAETLGRKGTSSQSVRQEQLRLVDRIGSEFEILLFAALERIREIGGAALAEGIRRLRAGEVLLDPGYDGEFGKVRVFRSGELDAQRGASLFASSAGSSAAAAPGGGSPIAFDVAEFQRRLREDGPAEVQEPDAATASETAAQREAIEFGEGVCLVVAGPGSGKTYTLTERIAHLIRQRRIPAEQIVAVTFSNQAAEEIRARLAARLGESAMPMVATFHALGLSILREHAAPAGRTPAVSILDDDERRELLARAAHVDRRQVAGWLRRIEAVKQGRHAEVSAELSPVLKAYERALAERDAVDLDDLIALPARLLRELPAVRAQVQQRMRWLCVDEYQDINARQYELIRRLAGDDAPNLMAIGDPDQAIYGFRGSDARLIERLREDYPSLRAIRLTRSWRCPDAVLRGAGQVLRKTDELEGTLGEIKIHIRQCATERSEADWIAERIEAMIGGVASASLHAGTTEGTEAEGITSFRDFAVLCRTSMMFEPFTDAFARHGVAFQVVGAAPFYRQEPWTSVIQQLRQAWRDPQESAATVPPSRCRAAGTSSATTPVGVVPASVPPLIIELIRRARPVAELVAAMLEGQPVSEVDRVRFERLAGPFGARYADFVRALCLRQGIDDYDQKAERVSLMTMHASKGLEFAAVFIPGCEDGLIPFEQFGKKSAEELAEEERLFYVAMTRTKRHLFLTHAQKRRLRGAVVAAARSPLLTRVERDLLETSKQEPIDQPKSDYTQLSIWK